MRHISTGEKSLFIDDLSADCLLAYLSALSDAQRSDVVRLRAVGVDGNEVEASVFLNAHTDLVSETATAELRPLDNARSIEYMQRKTELLRHPRPVQPTEAPFAEG